MKKDILRLLMIGNLLIFFTADLFNFINNIENIILVFSFMIIYSFSIEFIILLFYEIKGNFNISLLIFLNILFCVFLSEIIFNLLNKYFNFLLDVSMINILFIALSYLISAFYLSIFFYFIFRKSYIKEFVKEVRLDFEMLLFATVSTFIFHLALIFIFPTVPICFFRLVGFTFDILILNILIDYFVTAVKVNDSLFDYSFKHSNS